MPAEPRWWYRPPGLIAAALAPVAATYGAIATRRLSLPATYVSKLPVICIGNFTAGGTGKTPVAAMVAARLQGRGERPAVLTRGYGGTERGPHWVAPGDDTASRVGDEPLLLARTAPVMVSRDRAKGARAIEEDGRASVIIMDDGLHNPTLGKTISIAVVDGPRGFGNGRVIPAGPLRAPVDALTPCLNAIVLNGPLGVGVRLPDALPVLHGRIAANGDVGWLAGAKVVAYAGIGNPERFFATLRGLGARLAETVPFPDHHAFTPADADRLIATGTRHGAKLVTTEKDHVRLTGRLIPLAEQTAALAVTMDLDEAGWAALDGLLARALARR